MPLRDNQGRFCGTLSRKEADGGWELSFFVLDEEKLLLRYFSLTNSQEEILDWDDFEGEIDIRFITKIEDKSITEGYIEIQTCNKKFCVRAVTQGGTEEWVRTLRKAVVNPPKRQEGPQEKSKSLPSENDRDNGGNSKLAHISYQTKIIGGVVVRTPVRKSSDSDRTSSLSGDSRVRTGSGGPTSTIKIIKEGYLVKKGAVVRNWKRRFFRLDILKLAYYEKKEDKDPLKVISTAAIQSVRESIGLDSYREHLFEVNTDSRTFLFQAESAEEMKLWINALVGVSGKRGRSASGPPAPTMDSVKPTYENYAETTNL